MRVVIVAVGKQREKGLHLAAQEYLRRLSRYCKIEMLEVQDEKDPGPGAEALMKKAMDIEAGRILGRLNPQDYVVALDVAGKQRDSLSFSRSVKAWHDQCLTVAFVIGGSMGLGEKVLSRANESLSLSEMTFPHQLARVVLLEQIYRAYKIASGERYHK